MLKISLSCGLIGSALAAGGSGWDYKKNGDDWPSLTMADNACGNTKQSPIDLTVDMPSNKTVNFKRDPVNRFYTNIVNAAVKWVGATSKTDYVSGGYPKAY